MKTYPLRCFVIAAVLLSPFCFAGCASRSQTLEDPNDKFVVLEPVVGTRIKKRIRKSEVDGYVGIMPTKTSIVTEDTDLMTLPMPRP
jgi:hypothetical protein